MNISLDNSKQEKLQSILIIDDDKFIQKFISKTLSTNYTSLCASNGLEGIDTAKKKLPDIILLDVEMPGMNGYEVCDALKQDNKTRNIPIIFLSGKTSTREKMLGYEAGAVDFLTKPCEKEELIAKLNIHSNQHSTHRALESKAADASQTALIVMIGNNELGQVIQFMENAYAITSFEQLANRFFQVTNNLNLNCCLFFSTAEGNKFFSSKGSVTPLEMELMPALQSAGNRFHDFGCRTQITYPRVSLLIKNMPINDMETYGRYKDLFPSLLSATDAKIKALDTERALLLQSQSVSASFQAVNNTLSSLSNSLNDSQKKVVVSLSNMLTELEGKLPHMGLEEDQEAFLLKRVEDAIHNTHDLSDQSDTVQQSFQTITRLLQHLSERQQKILDMIFTRFDQEHLDETSNDGSGSDIELF
ncbi:hypothetical protein A9Q81_26780 [Gammaproteobacteria bacterium 42_54_T18]|nr:hypothetical protein A9Q81_26780 [Gammaproteobacteria bacterium 42_54_T18]